MSSTWLQEYSHDLLQRKGNAVSYFHDKEPETFKVLEAHFITKAHEKHTPIGPSAEYWYVIRDHRQMFISHHQFILVFTDRELAEKFSMVTGLTEYAFWIQGLPWPDIVRMCKYHFQGAVADWIVREDFTFHPLDCFP